MIDFDSVIWSYSRLNAYYNCKAAWHKAYVDKDRGDGNFFAESGSLMHQVLEDYTTSKVDLWDLSEYYDGLYSNFIKHKAPYNKFVNLEDKRIITAHEYLDNLEGFEDIGEVLAVEKKFLMPIGEKDQMIGYIDLLFKDGENYIILDHKSASNIKKNEYDEYFKQLYVYSKAIYDEFKVYPTKLILNQFNLKELAVEEFDINKYNAAIKWCERTIETIKNETSWDEYNYKNRYYCMNLCGHTKTCEYGKKAGWAKIVERE